MKQKNQKTKKTNKKRLSYFFALCILARFGIAALAFFILSYKPSLYLLPTTIGAVISVGFFYQHLANNRNTGAFNQKVWWHKMRIVHSILYFIFAILSFNKSVKAPLVVVIDTIIGIIAYINKDKLN